MLSSQCPQAQGLVSHPILTILSTKLTQLFNDREKMTQPERKNYLEAVQCMFTKPSTVSASWAAGARVRYDDFAAIHINKTLGIHGTGNFLTWHRYHNWLYEKALREDCGYRGAQPVSHKRG